MKELEDRLEHQAVSIRPRRRLRAITPTMVGALLSIVVVAVSACGSSQRAAPDPKPPVLLISAGAPFVEKACVDQTTSSVASFATTVLASVAAGVAGWPAPASPAQITVAQSPRPRLDLWVRTVSTHSAATDQEAIEIQVPEVPGLAAPPDIADPSLASDRLAWDRAAVQWNQAATAARNAAAAGAQQLRSLPLDRETSSAISGCLAAVAASGPQGPSVRLLLASDLEENEPPVVGAYGGSPLLVIQSCPAGTEGSCAQLAASWKARLGPQGAADIKVVRADASATEITSWVAGS